MQKISQIDEVPCQAEVRILQKITLKHSIALKLFLLHSRVSLMKGLCFIHRLSNNVTISESRATFHANITEPQMQEEQWWTLKQSGRVFQK